MTFKPATEALIWLLFAGGMWAYSYDFDKGHNVYALGIAHWPRAVLIFMVIIVLFYFIESCIQKQPDHKLENSIDQASELNQELTQDSEKNYKILIAITFCLPMIYLWLMPRAGYFVTTPIFLAGYIYLFGERKFYRILSSTLMVYAFLLLIFSKLLYVPLPTGNWPFFYNISNSLLVLLGSG